MNRYTTLAGMMLAASFFIHSELQAGATTVFADTVLAGSGTAGDPYRVTSYNELKLVGTTYGLDKVYLMTCDIDASASKTENSGAGFMPIGTYNKPFTGVFHGGNHLIKGLVVCRPAAPSGGVGSGVGLFGNVTGGAIDSVGVVGGKFTGYYYVGALVGLLQGGSISCCYATSPVVCTSAGGGLVGYVGGAAVRNCYASGSVKGVGAIGGFYGWGYGGLLYHCYSTGWIACSSTECGGFSGRNSEVTVTSCYWNTGSSGQMSDGRDGGAVGLTTSQMMQEANFINWDFSTVWKNSSNNSYPGLQCLDNAPMTIAEQWTIHGRGFTVADLYTNDYDIETGRTNLVYAIDSLSIGSITDGEFEFPTTSVNGDTARVFYRCGEVRSSDTLWGSTATSVVVLACGYGTAASPYLIQRYKDFSYIGSIYGLDKVYRLVCDIDASASKTDNGGSGYTPVGSTYSNTFTGIFHGGGHTVSDLYINRPSTNYLGLFGRVNGGMIDSVQVVRFTAIGGNNIGCVVGSLYGGTMSACYGSGTITSTYGYAGVLAGSSWFGTITNCYASGTATGTTCVGGLVGYNYGYNSFAVISGCYATGSVSGNSEVGGFVGYTNRGTISESYANVRVKGTNYDVGGFAGLMSASLSTIANCYAAGEVSMANYSYGGFVGSLSAGSLSNCYWNKETSQRDSDGTNSTAVGLTNAQMKQASSFSGWDFIVNWTIKSDNSFPGLRNLNNAPFAFPATFFAKKNKVVTLLPTDSNSCDIETNASQLAVAIDSTNTGTYSGSTFWFPITAINGDTARVWYKIGEVRTADTLWGGYSNGVIVLNMPGSGTTADPYLVTDYEDLKAVGVVNGLSASYRVVADIDASASATENDGNGFDEIGTTYTKPFTGKFFGSGHTIRNLTINRANADFVGLFGCTSYATIDSIALSNASITGDLTSGVCAGGLVAYCLQSTVSNCSVSGTVTGMNDVGGLIGWGLNAAISNSSASASVRCVSGEGGGLIGASGICTISNSYATGSVSGMHYLGGLVGEGSSSTFTNCYSTGTVTGTTDIGGFIGRIYSGSPESYLNNCYWDSISSNMKTGIGTNSGTASAIGLTTAQMKDSSNFSGWNFTSTWNIIQGSTSPGIRTINNAPFAYSDSIVSGRVVTLSQLLKNDYDIESKQTALTLRVINCTAGTLTNPMKLTLPDTLKNGLTATLLYQVGEIRPADTLWGNRATVIIRLDTTVTAIEHIVESQIPTTIALKNYPNPFNPSTTIQISLPALCKVSLRIYNILGQEVALLMNGTKEAGYHTVTWNAMTASGIYFCRLEATSVANPNKRFFETRKMLLLR